MGWDLLLGIAVGFVVAALTTPVGVSGAVFLLPVQLSVLHVPSPAVSPTNLLYNVVAVPGALLRYGAVGAGWSELARRLVAGTLPGVIAGALLRIFVVPGGTVFRLLISILLLPLGLWLIAQDRRAVPRTDPALSPKVVSRLGFAAGMIGGVYGIGGGSLLAPVLVACGYLVAEVAPAALLATFVTSCVGAATYALLALTGRGEADPHWLLGMSCGVGGLVGGYVGAGLQPRIPQRLLRPLLGAVAVTLAVVYLVGVVRA